MTSILTQSCTEELINTEKQQLSVSKAPKVENGILSFSSHQSLKQYLSDSDENILKNGITKKFISLADILNSVIDEEIKHNKSIEKMNLSSSEINKRHSNGSIKKYSKLTQYYINKGTVSVFTGSDDNCSYLDLTLQIFGLRSVLNEDGLIVINDTIYQFNNDKIILICDGNFEKIKLLKNNIYRNDENIHVINIENIKHLKNTKTIKEPGSYTWQASDSDIVGRRDSRRKLKQTIEYY